jgi:FAD/FMN-containing dehydrogenase
MSSLNVVVQPSVPWMDLNEKIKESGLFFPIDPGPSVSFPHQKEENCTDLHQRPKLVAWLEQTAGQYLELRTAFRSNDVTAEPTQSSTVP